MPKRALRRVLPVERVAGLIAVEVPRRRLPAALRLPHQAVGGVIGIGGRAVGRRLQIDEPPGHVVAVDPGAGACQRHCGAPPIGIIGIADRSLRRLLGGQMHAVAKGPVGVPGGVAHVRLAPACIVIKMRGVQRRVGDVGLACPLP